MRVVLTIASGPDEGRRILLRPGQTAKVGRTEWADLSVPYDSRMSSVHFSLSCDQTTCRIQDLDSTNGTRVNDQEVAEATLNDGDSIAAGRTTFSLHVELSDPAATSVSTQAEGKGPATAGVSTDLGAQEPPAPIPRDGVVQATVLDKLIIPPSLLAAAGAVFPYDKALVDEDPLVRREARLAAAWRGEKWLLEYCRLLVVQPLAADWDALLLLAILGQPSDLERILTIGRAKELGARRFEIYASYGSPHVLRDLLASMRSRDANTAVAAGVAFTKITGAEIESQDRVELPPEDGSEPDDFEKEFLEEAFVPSPRLAEEHWKKVKDEFVEGIRWRCGIDVSAPVTSDLLARLDMEGRWETCLRGKYEGTWQGSRQELERFRPTYASP